MAKVASFLGKSASELMEAQPFMAWRFDRSLEKDLPYKFSHYVCATHGMSFTCDGYERICSIFVKAPHVISAGLGLPLETIREGVARQLGAPR